ncbi:16400_t:CDS:2 [Cetraspora pellucida]|uniref:16400_t:CDS:1 n=1 Tax=Cetraspora pellucida TaxID=1433469 RepID=A0A9N9E2H9_9GLOM|nr:16400_t:CDS:2 [Cetraspora pellucida]
MLELKFFDIQIPEFKFPDILMPEFKFPDIQMPEFDFSNVESSISTIIMIIVICLVVIIISYCLITVCARCCCGFGADEIAEGSCAATCQSAGATGKKERDMGNNSSIASKSWISFKTSLIKKYEKYSDSKVENEYQKNITEIRREKEFRQRQISKNHYGDYIFDHRALLKRGQFGTIHLAVVHPKKSDSSLKMVVVKVTPIAVKYYNRWFIGDKCPNIINFIGWFISRDAFYLIVDYHEGGTLADCIPPNGRDEYSTLNLMIQVFDAVKYIHDHGIAHCDIKPENILLSSDRKRLILADFGHSQLECDDLIKDPEYFQTKSEASKVMKGTAGFYSPERDPREHIPFKGFKKADMYSLGVTIYVVLTYHLPFDPTQSIRHQSLLFPDHISLPAQHFIQNLLSIDPSRRMIISDCFNHSWLRIHDISGRRPKQSLNNTNDTNQPKKFYKINHNIFSRRKHLFNQKNCDIG